MSTDNLRKTALQAYDLLMMEQPKLELEVFRKAISAASKSGNPGKVREILAQAKEVEQHLESKSFLMALKAFSADGQRAESLDMLHSVLASTDNKSRHAAAYAWAMNSYTSSGEWQQPLVMLREMQSAGLSATATHYAAVMASALRATWGAEDTTQQHQLVADLWHEMLNNTIEPNTYCCRVA
jgi:hypothetical protein